MIRFHWQGGEKYLVTARRKPRGYVERAKETQHSFKEYSRYHAEYSCTYREGWRPVGFNGVKGRVFATRNDAAAALVSAHMFWKGLENDGKLLR